MKLVPMGERVLVEAVKTMERTTSGGIVMPASSEASATREGIIRAVPEGSDLKVGTRVLFDRRVGLPFGDAGLRVLDIKDILAVYEGG